ncbi:MAG: ATP-binding protein, partial [Omnitrophica WOR_2 bacterium]
LDGFLRNTLIGHGQVAFITGEPGSGKTMLFQEFTRRVLATHPEVTVVNGNCNAYTGIGDPYLPFLEMLSMLAGELEMRWTGGAITTEQARRLWQLLPDVVDALVDDGPELINCFMSGAALLTRARSGAHDQLAKLDALLKSKAGSAGVASLQQTDLFEQYSKVLQRLAGSHPLLLFVDDLQWADAGSISLLFHLGRRLPGHRILLVGAYRPGEVAAGHDGGRYPLEAVLHELQREYGDNQVDLSKAEGRRWIDMLLDSEPNRLGEDFRETFFRHTNGHALFTVELLRGLQDRGDLVKDESGCWVEGRALDWETLPPRVEAVIAESIRRLPDIAQSILSIASVEGETFTAQAVSRIQDVEDREVIRLLSGPLSKLHRLVNAAGSQRLGERQIAVYRFRHFLIQKYLYNRLDEVERARLHEVMGNVLEALYGEQFPEITLQLARHFEISGLTARAVKYLHLAGEQAVRLYANTEAITHYQQALDLLQNLPDASDRAILELRLRVALGVPLTATRGFSDLEMEQNIERTRELTRQVETTPGDLLEVLSELKSYYDLRLSLHKAYEAGEDMLKLAEKMNKPSHLSFAYHHMSTTSLYLGRLGDFFEYRRRGNELYDRETFQTIIFPQGLDPEVSGLCHSSLAYWLLGYPEQARQKSQEALAWAEELGHPFMIAWAKFFAAQLYCYLREVTMTRKAAEETIAISRDIGAAVFLAAGNVLMGWVLAEQGQFAEAVPQQQQALTTLGMIGAELGRIQQIPLLLDTYAKAGRAAEGLALVEEALKEASAAEYRMVEPDLLRCKGELLLVNGNPAVEAEAYFLKSIEMARNMEAKSWELRAALSLCRLWQRQGKSTDAYPLLSSIYNWFTEGFDTLDLIEARQLLDELAGR